MNTDEVLDNHTHFGDRHKFVVTGDTLFIYDGKIRLNSHIRKIPILDIEDIRYEEGSVGKGVSSFIIGALALIISDGILFGYDFSDRNRIEVDYSVDGDEAKGSFNTTLKLGEIEELRKLLRLPEMLEII